jgi:hypothetical protein
VTFILSPFITLGNLRIPIQNKREEGNHEMLCRKDDGRKQAVEYTLDFMVDVCFRRHLLSRCRGACPCRHDLQLKTVGGMRRRDI